MHPDVEARLKNLVNFPSPPGVAGRVIEIAEDPEVDLVRVAEVISADPALVAKIMRTANSAVYAKRRRSENLHQALTMLGLNATLTLALSFSLVKALRTGEPAGLDYREFWHRALLSGVAARALGEALGSAGLDELFLGALLQDVGMLALDRAVPGLYGAAPADDHRALAACEHERVGADHAQVGQWLMSQWNLPERLCTAIGRSHAADGAGFAASDGVFERCVAISGAVADRILHHREGGGAELSALAHRLQDELGLDADGLGKLLARIEEMIPETAALFDTDMPAVPEALAEHAREILLVRSLSALNEVDSLRHTADTLSARASELEAESCRDFLTGAFNRAYLEQWLAREFKAAVRDAQPITVVFCDIDFFKRINDNFGHHVGDLMLRSVAEVLRANVRDTDIVARYGGEEFVIVLPEADTRTAVRVCERIALALRKVHHAARGQQVGATLSMGVATRSASTRFDAPAALVLAADEAMYAAKRQGRDRIVCAEDSAQPLEAVAG